MERRINRQLLLIGFTIAFLTIMLTATTFFSLYEDNLKSSLQTDLALVSSVYESGEASDFGAPFQSLSVRVTLIDAVGEVVFDSHADVQSMNNHMDRPEVRQALQEGFGEAVRFSDTLGEKEYYVAQRLSDGRVIRCSVHANFIADFLRISAIPLLLIFLAVVILSICLSAVLTDHLIQPIKSITDDPDDLSLLDEDNDTVYPELKPLIRELRSRRKELQENVIQIEQEHRRLTTVLENMEEGLLLLDTDSRILSVNQSMCNYLHLKEKHIGRLVHDVVHEDRILRAVTQACEQTRSAFDITKDGRQLHVMIDPVCGGGKTMGIVCLLVDVTERRELERMKQEFTANVSRELKTPLTSVSGYAEMIENGMARADDIPVFAARIRRESARLLTLIGDIILLSEIEERGQTLSMQKVDLYRAAQDCLERLEDAAAKRNITLSVDGLPTTILADPTMIAQLCYNLCDNAIRYNREGGTVNVTIGERMITVTDSGIGIPDEHKSRIFERFYRVDKSRSKETGGTGLGLAIVKHIAEVHGAVVTLSSRENVGTRIRVRFPE